MKLNNLFICMAVAGLCFTAACTDLEPEVYTDVKKEDYFKTPEQFSTLLANAYSQMNGEYGYLYREGYWGLQEYTTDELVIPVRGTDWDDNGAPRAMHQHTWISDSREVNNGWSFVYGGVTKCNDVLNNIKTIIGEDVPEEEYTDAQRSGIAETKTLRAFYHMLAMDIYGDGMVIDDNEHEVEQVSRKKAFEWIEQEILDNIDGLTRQVRYGSITRSVAHMMLAKLYLNAEVYTGTARWDDCAAQCDSIIDGGYGYILNSDYFETFKVSNTGNKEIILPIVFDAVYAKGNMFHLITLHYVFQQVFGFLTEPWNGPCTLGSFYDKYDNNDTRKAQWFVGPILRNYTSGDTLLYSNGSTLVNVPAIITDTVSVLIDPTANNTFEGPRFVKFELEHGIEHHANSDFPIYRYADVLLMKAECIMRSKGVDAEAVSLVNKVRERTGLADYTIATLTLDELLDERGRELAWEGHRRQDLIRFDNRFCKGTWEFKDASSEKRKIFPIPEWVLTANPNYKQNDWK